jgi:hypothetical protein
VSLYGDALGALRQVFLLDERVRNTATDRRHRGREHGAFVCAKRPLGRRRLLPPSDHS